MAAIPPSFPLPPPPQHPQVPPPLPPEKTMPNPPDAAGGAPAASTLLFRHLPEVIPQDVLSHVLSNYGAVAVRSCAGGRLRNCAFVDFKDEAVATQVQSQFHRSRFLGKTLTVERADKANLKNADPLSENLSIKDTSSVNPSNLKEPCIGSTNLVSVGEPISSRLGVDYPFPPHLEYAYPPPDGDILTNILNALIAVPRFYVQVLHLMNKMNIPAPFRKALPTPPLPPSAPAPAPPPPPVSIEPSPDLSSDESEMASSEEEADNVRGQKRARRETIVGPAVDKGVTHEDVGLKSAPLVPKEVPMIKRKIPVLQIKITPKSTPKETTNDISSTKRAESVEEHVEQKLFATPQEIEKGKLPPEEILSLPMFKNYSPGNPASVLYIKNLAKDVVVDDFYFIFGSLFENIDAAKSGLVVKLMQEGRMRGQAFVTFPSIDLAQHALNLVNGYMFKGKPMIIQFGRNPAANKGN